MKKSSIHVLIMATICLLVSFATVAQDKKLYSWTDENGTVHFSDVQPEGQDVEERNIPQDAPPASDNPYHDVDTGPSAAEQRRQDIAGKSERDARTYRVPTTNPGASLCPCFIRV